MQTEELTGFATVLADWTQAATKLNAYLEDFTPAEGDRNGAVLFGIVQDLNEATATFERLMGVDAPVPPEAGRVLFCAAPQLGTVIGRTIGNGDAKYVVQLASGALITVPAAFIGGEEAAKAAYMETQQAATIRRPSPDGKR